MPRASPILIDVLFGFRLGLKLNLDRLGNLLREADYWAAKEGREAVSAAASMAS